MPQEKLKGKVVKFGWIEGVYVSIYNIQCGYVEVSWKAGLMKLC